MNTILCTLCNQHPCACYGPGKLTGLPAPPLPDARVAAEHVSLAYFEGYTEAIIRRHVLTESALVAKIRELEMTLAALEAAKPPAE